MKYNKGTLLFVCLLFLTCEISCRAYLRKAYTRSTACVKEKVGLSAGGLYAGGLMGGEIRYPICSNLYHVVTNTINALRPSSPLYVHHNK